MHIGFFLADQCNNISYNERGSWKWRTGGWSLSYASFPVSSYRIHNLLFIRVQGSKGKKSTWIHNVTWTLKSVRSEAPRQKIVRVCNKAESTCAWGSMIANWSESDYQNVGNDSRKTRESNLAEEIENSERLLRELLCNWNHT